MPKKIDMSLISIPEEDKIVYPEVMEDTPSGTLVTLEKEVTRELPDSDEECFGIARECYLNSRIEQALRGWYIGRISYHLNAKHGEKDKMDQELANRIGSGMRYVKMMKAIYGAFQDYASIKHLVQDLSLGTSKLREIIRLDQAGQKKVLALLEKSKEEMSLEEIQELVNQELHPEEAPGEAQGEAKKDTPKGEAPDTLKTKDIQAPSGEGSSYFLQLVDTFKKVRQEYMTSVEDVHTFMEDLEKLEGQDRKDTITAMGKLLEELDEFLAYLEELARLVSQGSGALI